MPTCRVGRGISAPALLRTVRDPLESYGSCHLLHPARCSHFHWLLMVSHLSSLPASVTPPRRSTAITAASSLPRVSPLLSGASLLLASAVWPRAFSLNITG